MALVRDGWSGLPRVLRHRSRAHEDTRAQRSGPSTPCLVEGALMGDRATLVIYGDFDEALSALEETLETLASTNISSLTIRCEQATGVEPAVRHVLARHQNVLPNIVL